MPSTLPKNCLEDCRQNACTASVCIVLAPQLDNNSMTFKTADGSKLMTWPLKHLLRIHSVDIQLQLPVTCSPPLLPHTGVFKWLGCQTKLRSVLHPGHLCHADAMPARCFVQPV